MEIQVVATRQVEIRGKEYRPGQVVDVSGLSDFKIGQLLNRRILRPALPGEAEEDDDPVLT